MNDAYDNAYTDKEILEEINQQFARDRAANEAAGPSVGLAPGVCKACQGSGGEAHFEYDEWNPAGWWETDPCSECHGSGLSKGVNDELDRLVYAERDLDHCRQHLDLLDTMLASWKARIESIAMNRLSTDDNDMLNDVIEEINETRDRVWPEPEEAE